MQKATAIVAATAAVLAVALIPPMTTASATTWPPPAPVTNDACGIKQDRFFLTGDEVGEDFGWVRGTEIPSGPSDAWLPSGWVSSDGASAVTVTAVNFRDMSKGPTYQLSFDASPDAGCVEALDTLTAVVGACNRSTGGTLVDFTWANTDDGSDWAHKAPQVFLTRRDGLGTNFELDKTGKLEVPDGGSIRIVDGDQLSGDHTRPFVIPGTHRVDLYYRDGKRVTLRNRISVPACGDHFLPWGDAMVGKPYARVGDCRNGRVRATFDSRGAVAPVRYRLGYFKGKRWQLRSFMVAPGAVKSVWIRNQVSRKWVYAGFDLTSIPGRATQKRTLRC